MLTSLRITQRLGLLVMLPLGALVVTSLPATVERADQARAAASILHAATSAQAIDLLIGDLQRERLLALSFVSTTRARRASLITQAGVTAAQVTQARERIGAAGTELGAALDATDGLAEVRRRVLVRSIAAAEVYQQYTGTIDALLTALRLGGERAADAAGLRQMASLDALLRLNEEAAKVGAALVLASADPAFARNVITVATPLALAHERNLQRNGDGATLTLAGRMSDTATATRTEALAAAVLAAPAQAAALEDSLAVAENGLRVRQVVGERVTADIATQATARAAQARNAAAAVAALGVVLSVLLIWLGVAISRSVARPLRRITLAATAVADLAAREMVRVADPDSPDQGPPRLAAVTIRTADEVGELASAFNRVQATAALLMEQQVTTRRNVAVMFGNIANRTRSLVARQLADIDELERDERDEERLTRLYHLDHLTTRLRRSSDSLLVIAGTDQVAQMATPTALPEIVRSAVAQVEGFQSVRLGALCHVVVAAAVVSDLTLLLAELVENATSFSPPGVTVDVTATLTDAVLIRIVDRGVGMAPDRLAAENRRLVTRERLDLVPTASLGLVVAGRIARRHGLTVRLVSTPVSGVTAEVVLPPGLLLGAESISGSPDQPFAQNALDGPTQAIAAWPATAPLFAGNGASRLRVVPHGRQRGRRGPRWWSPPSTAEPGSPAGERQPRHTPR